MTQELANRTAGSLLQETRGPTLAQRATMEGAINV